MGRWSSGNSSYGDIQGGGSGLDELDDYDYDGSAGHELKPGSVVFFFSFITMLTMLFTQYDDDPFTWNWNETKNKQ